jgi:hypothetical protein
MNISYSIDDILNTISSRSNRARNSVSFDNDCECNDADDDISQKKLKKESSPSCNCSNNNNDPFLFAMYNIIAVTVFILFIVLSGLLLMVLQSFVRSILWALLTSAFLFATKQYLAEFACSRLEIIEQKGQCLALQLSLMPIYAIDTAVDKLWLFMRSKYKLLLSLCGAIIGFHLFVSFYEQVVTSLSSLTRYLMNMATFLATFDDSKNSKISLIQYTIIIGYIFGLIFYWRRERTLLFQIMSLPVWFTLILMVSHTLGHYQYLFTIAFIFLTLVGIYSYLHEIFIDYQKNQRKFIEISSFNSTESDNMNDISSSSSPSQVETNKNSKTNFCSCFNLKKISNFLFFSSRYDTN